MKIVVFCHVTLCSLVLHLQGKLILKRETVGYSEIRHLPYQVTRRHIPEYSKLHSYRFLMSY
jgi:hypothetical protein